MKTIMVRLIGILNPKIIQIGFKPVLRGEAGIHQVAMFIVPLMQTTIIEHF